MFSSTSCTLIPSRANRMPSKSKEHHLWFKGRSIVLNSSLYSNFLATVWENVPYNRNLCLDSSLMQFSYIFHGLYFILRNDVA
jgi:hypothetical protein